MGIRIISTNARKTLQSVAAGNTHLAHAAVPFAHSDHPGVPDTYRTADLESDTGPAQKRPGLYPDLLQYSRSVLRPARIDRGCRIPRYDR